MRDGVRLGSEGGGGGGRRRARRPARAPFSAAAHNGQSREWNCSVRPNAARTRRTKQDAGSPGPAPWARRGPEAAGRPRLRRPGPGLPYCLPASLPSLARSGALVLACSPRDKKWRHGIWTGKFICLALCLARSGSLAASPIPPPPPYPSLPRGLGGRPCPSGGGVRVSPASGRRVRV